MTQPGSVWQVVKVQAAVFGGGRNPRGLVYAEGRVHLHEQPIPPVVAEHLLTRPSYKAYFEGLYLGPSMGWQIGALTLDQLW